MFFLFPTIALDTGRIQHSLRALVCRMLKREVGSVGFQMKKKRLPAPWRCLIQIAEKAVKAWLGFKQCHQLLNYDRVV